MSNGSPVAAMLADMVEDTSHGSPFHSLKQATEGLTTKALTYKPVPKIARDWGQEFGWHTLRILTPRYILLHVTGAAEAYANHLAPRTRHKCEGEWDAFSWDQPFRTPKSVLGATDLALRRLHARATKVTDQGLPRGCGMWGVDAARLFVLMDGGILHAAWHGGQLSILRDMYAALAEKAR